jgi:hypothetical protein
MAVRQVTFEIQDEWTIEELYRAFEELRDNLDTGLVRNIEQYVSGWNVQLDNADTKVIRRTPRDIESGTQKFTTIITWDKRTDTVLVTLAATGADREIYAKAREQKVEER